MVIRVGRGRKLEELRRMPLLAGLGERDLGRIAGLVQRLTVEEGRMLVEEGWPGFEFFFVVEGFAEVSTGGEVIATLGPGDWFGETSLIEDRPRTATVTARSPMTLLAMGRRVFGKLLSTVPEVADRIRSGADPGQASTA